MEQAYGFNSTLYIKYEHLKDNHLRVAELSKIASFLNRPASDERLQCAFVLSENEQVSSGVSETVSELESIANQIITVEMIISGWLTVLCLHIVFFFLS